MPVLLLYVKLRCSLNFLGERICGNNLVLIIAKKFMGVNHLICMEKRLKVKGERTKVKGMAWNAR